jgi:hypothetical protein
MRSRGGVSMASLLGRVLQTIDEAKSRPVRVDHARLLVYEAHGFLFYAIAYVESPMVVYTVRSQVA